MGLLEPSLSSWSAGHVSNGLENITGVFFSNRPAELDRAPLTFEKSRRHCPPRLVAHH